MPHCRVLPRAAAARRPAPCCRAPLLRVAACVLRRCRTLPRAGTGEEGAQVVGEEAPVQLSTFSIFNVPLLQFQHSVSTISTIRSSMLNMFMKNVEVILLRC